VRSHFESVYHERKNPVIVVKNSNSNNDSENGSTSTTTSPSTSSAAETKQMEALQRQFDQASKHLSNHVEELEQKILSVIEAILQQHLSTWTASSASLPSANFRALCKQVIIRC
jgi:hypothetical protein